MAFRGVPVLPGERRDSAITVPLRSPRVYRMVIFDILSPPQQRHELVLFVAAADLTLLERLLNDAPSPEFVGEFW